MSIIFLWLNGQIHTAMLGKKNKNISGKPFQKSEGSYNGNGGKSMQTSMVFQWVHMCMILRCSHTYSVHSEINASVSTLCYTSSLTQLRRLEWDLPVCYITTLMFPLILLGCNEMIWIRERSKEKNVVAKTLAQHCSFTFTDMQDK